jgi:formiminotetrahydrofolate cyclodeaminase
MEIRRFLEKLSSGTPTPGGGSASALAGALSAALVAMTAGLSLKQGRLRKEEVEDIRKRALAIQKRLLRAVDEDAKSYEAVLKAFRLPKNTERGRLHRSRIIQKAYQEATAIPQLVCQLSIQLLEYSKTLIFKGNPNAISDAGVAAFLADAALAGGLLNININLVPGTEKTFLEKMHSLMGRWEKKGNQLRGEIEKALHEIHGI